MKQIINVENDGLKVFVGKNENKPVLYKDTSGNIIIDNESHIVIEVDED